MSFENQGKSGGRRKAREFALQMLFAADVVHPIKYSTREFWLEIGFGELTPDLVVLVRSFRDKLEKLLADATGIKSIVKRADPLDKADDRLEELKTITTSISEALSSFKFYVTGLFVTNASELVEIKAYLTRSIEGAEKLTEGFAEPTSRETNDDQSKVNDFIDRSSKITLDLIDTDLPAIQEITESTRLVRDFANGLVIGTLKKLGEVDDKIRTRAEHWRIERMAIVDRNVLRLAVYEFLYTDTPNTVVINEALEIARRFSTFEATQFINGILDAIKLDLENGHGKGANAAGS